MALTERTEISKIEIVGQWSIVQVREDTVVERDGEEIARTHHRFVVSPGDDHTGLDPKVRAICEALHTTDLISEYKASLEQEAE
jgi:hypothetical protein